MNKLISVAIDGPSGAGKSTIARAAAKRFGFIYVDTGAIYRTVAYAVHLAGKSCTDADAVRALLSTISVSLDYDSNGVQRMLLDGNDVSEAIRTPENSIRTSQVSALPEVRAFLMDMQRDQAKRHNVVMDGRDIGTVVLPDAELKIYLTASPEARAERRLKELREKGQKVSFEEVLKDINYRDEQDMNRAAAPLKKADDALLVDSSEIDFDQTFALLCEIVIDRLAITPEIER